MSTNKPTGRWTPGVSGNPGGRRPGSGSVQQLRRGIEASIPEIIRTLTEKAIAGDISAARLLLERAIPALRPTDAPQRLQIQGDDPLDQAKSIFCLAASGELPAGQAVQLVAALGTIGKLIEVGEFERRILTLEELVEARNISKA